MRGRERALRGLLVLCAVSLPLAACSDDEGSADDSASTTTSTTTTTTAAGAESGSTTVTPTTVPAPGGGTITDEVPGTPGLVADPVAIDASTSFGDGVDIRVAEIRAINVEASLPGEKSGAGVAITLEITNTTAAPIDLGRTTVDLTNSEGLSATDVSSMTQPFTGELAAGQKATGTYVFTVPTSERSDVQLKVKYSGATPTVVFAGSLPNA